MVVNDAVENAERRTINYYRKEFFFFFLTRRKKNK